MTRRVAPRGARRRAASTAPSLERDRDHQPARDRRRLGPATGEPIHHALVWQDRRTAARCDELREAGHEPLVRERTGLVIDPYFSGTKIEWLLRNVDGGASGRGLRHDRLLARLQARPAATSPTSPTPRGRCCSTSAALAGTRSCASCSASTRRALPEPLASAQVYGTTSRVRRRGPGRRHRRRPAGGAVRPGLPRARDGKNTYGTGSFVLLNAGERAARAAVEGLLDDRRLGASGGETDLRARGGGVRHRRRGAVAARRPRHHRRRRPRPRRWPPRSTPTTASTSSRR